MLSGQYQYRYAKRPQLLPSLRGRRLAVAVHNTIGFKRPIARGGPCRGYVGRLSRERVSTVSESVGKYGVQD